MNSPIGVALCVFLSFPALVVGQQTAGPGIPALAEPKPTEVATPPGRIQLDVVVTDKAGKPVTGLEAKDFALLDGKSVSKLTSFQAFGGATATPGRLTEVILLFDYVNDDFKNVTAERREVEGFLKENGGHLAQPVSIFVLRDAAGLQALRPPSTEGNELAAGVETMDTALPVNSNTAGANGDIEKYNESLHAISSVAAYETKRPGRKLLLWIGPGWPLLDSPHFQVTSDTQKQFFKQIVELSGGLREARVHVYSVGIGAYGVQYAGRGNPDSNQKASSGPATFVEVPDSTSPTAYQSYLKEVKQFSQAKAANLSVKVLALHNGGRVLGLDNSLKAQIDTCVQDASAFYTLSFDPPHAGQVNEYHDLKLEIDQPGLIAHTNSGYYNQP